MHCFLLFSQMSYAKFRRSSSLVQMLHFASHTFPCFAVNKKNSNRYLLNKITVFICFCFVFYFKCSSVWSHTFSSWMDSSKVQSQSPFIWWHKETCCQHLQWFLPLAENLIKIMTVVGHWKMHLFFLSIYSLYSFVPVFGFFNDSGCSFYALLFFFPAWQ